MSPDVAVLGGGVIGLSVAYHLAREGAAVALVERARPGSAPGATWASAGGLRSQGRHAAERTLSIRAAARWPSLSEELDADLETAFGGHLHLAETQADAIRIRQRVADDQAGGIAAELVDEAAIHKIAPGVAKSAILGAFTPGDGQAHPGRTAKAFAAAAKRLGTTVIEGTSGTPFLEGGRVTGVRLSDDRIIRSAVVVLATGAWSVSLLDRLQLTLPLRWRGLQMILSEVTSASLAPTVTATGRNLSLKQLPSGQMMVGGNWIIGQDATISPKPVASDVARQWSAAVGIFPAMAGLAMAQTWAGAEAQTSDALPFIGRLPIDGLYLAIGFSNHGFQISPEIGALVARDILNSPESLLEPFRPGRGLETSFDRIAAFRDEAVAVRP